jgi:hypothetical protein
MSSHSNHLESFASNRTQTSDTKSGEVIMNRMQKAAAAVVAFAITLVGSVCVTAPMALADVQPLALHQAVSVLGAKVNSFSADVMSRRS